MTLNLNRVPPHEQAGRVAVSLTMAFLSLPLLVLGTFGLWMVCG